MDQRTMRAILAVVSGLSFACTESDVSGLDAGGNAADARIDAPLGTPDGGVDAAPIDATPPIDALITDAYFVGDAGLSARKEYHFTVDMEDLPQSFATTGASVKWFGTDGDPPGSLQFTATKLDEAQGTVKAQSPFFTWESWGVPHGAQVVYVGMKSYKRRLAGVVNMDHYWAYQIVGNAGESVHYGKDNGPYLEIASLTHDPQDAWETVTEGLQNYEVKPAYRASDTQLHVKVWWFPIRSGSIDWRLDEIQLDVVYVMP